DLKAIFLLQRFIVVARDEVPIRCQARKNRGCVVHQPLGANKITGIVSQLSVYALRMCGEKLLTRLPLSLEYDLGRGGRCVVALHFGGQFGAQVGTLPPKYRKCMGVAVEFAGERGAGSAP